MRKIFLVLLMFALAPAALPDGAGTVQLARYNNGQITLDEFARRQPALLSWAGIGVDAKQIEDAVEQIVFESVLAREAVESGLDRAPEIKAQIDRVLTAAYLKEHVPQEELTVQDREVEAYYTTNREKYRKPDQIRIFHILRNSLAEADKFHRELVAGSWKDHSEQSLDRITAKRGGAFGAISSNLLIPELRHALEGLPPGTVSDPVKSAFGYHLLKIERTSQTEYSPLEEVRSEIHDELMDQKRRSRIKTVKEDLWRKYAVAINEAAISDLVNQNAGENVTVDRSSVSKPRQAVLKTTELQVITGLIDLGPLPPRKRSEEVLLANSSAHPIDITKVGSSCPCMQVSVADKTVVPGGLTKLYFTYDPRTLNDGGNVERTLFVESNDAIEPKKVIRVRANIQKGTGR